MEERMATQSNSNLTKNLTTLIVDDDDITRQLLRGILRSAGFQVVGEAGDGEKALALFQKLRPQVICMDIDMPGMSGIEALKKIRETDGEAIVLMITGAATGDNVRGAITAGASGVIAKPFNTAKIISEVERAWQRARAKPAAS